MTLIMDNQKRIGQIRKYMIARQNGDLDACLSILSDDFSFYSQKDGSYNGKQEFLQYLNKNPYKGKWGEPYFDKGRYRVDGTVKILMIPINVKIEFDFDQNDKVCRASVTKR